MIFVLSVWPRYWEIVLTQFFLNRYLFCFIRVTCSFEMWEDLYARPIPFVQGRIQEFILGGALRIHIMRINLRMVLKLYSHENLQKQVRKRPNCTPLYPHPTLSERSDLFWTLIWSFDKKDIRNIFLKVRLGM